MSLENVEIVKGVHPPSGTELNSVFADDSLAQERIEALSAYFEPDFEFFGGVSEQTPGIRLSGRGLAELAERWREWMAPWEVYRTEVEDFIDAGEDKVVVLIRDHGRLRGSDAEVVHVAASVWTIREGKVARVEFHATREDALESAGMESSGR